MSEDGRHSSGEERDSSESGQHTAEGDRQVNKPTGTGPGGLDVERYE